VDDVVAVEVELASGERRYFITWGRVQDNVDPAPLEALVLSHASRFDLGGPAVAARVCLNLQEARNEPYFYESLVDIAREPRSTDHVEWRRRTAEAMAGGRALWYLGRA
jgi:hypothetical protein